MSKIKFTNADSFLSGYDFGHPFIYAFFSSIDIFSPKGELISPHLLRCGPFEVDNHVFMGRRLASAAISAREQYKFHSKYVDTNYKNKKKGTTMINNESSPGNSPIDLPSALARIGNDESFLQELLELYKMDFETKIEGLQKAIDQQDFVSIQELGHSLKGASANLSLPLLQKAALNMECAGRDKNLDKARGALATLDQEFQSLQEFLSAEG